MKPLTELQLKEILGAHDIVGTPEQIKHFSIRITELMNLNGEQWIRNNAQRLLAQWYCAVGHTFVADKLDHKRQV
jgi:hypothetical protein